MFDVIIPIGETCNITFLLQKAKIKKQTTLFEWFVSPSLNDITNILIKIGNNTDNDIIKMQDDNIFIGDNIYSGHYNYENFKTIYQRRRDRLINIIKSNENILFVRVETKDINYNIKDIDDFINSILYINPNLKNIKLCLINQNVQIEHPALINIYNKCYNDIGCESQEMFEFFISILEKLEYNLKDTIDICFTDMSEL